MCCFFNKNGIIKYYDDNERTNCMMMCDVSACAETLLLLFLIIILLFEFRITSNAVIPVNVNIFVEECVCIVITI